MNIPNAKPDLTPREMHAVMSALESGLIADGPDVERFEKQFARRVSSIDAVAVSNGFSALHLGLLALGVQRGDEVILPCVSTCPAMRNAVVAAGAVPVYADTNPGDFNLSVESVRRKISGKTRCVIAPHHTGVAADIPALNALGIPVLEDAAQALGASWEGTSVGSLGTAGVFSFYATKIITTIDGGMVTSRSPEIADRVREYRYYRDRWDQALRFNYKMQNAGAALGCVQLERLDEMLSRRNAMAARYRDVFEANGCPHQHFLHQRTGDICFRWAVRLSAGRKQALVESFTQRGLPFREDEMHFMSGPEMAGPFPNAVRLMEETITFPAYPAMTDAGADQIIGCIDETLAKTARG